MNKSTIIYTHTDEAPALATHSLLPIIRAFGATAGVDFVTSDISLAGRILAAFPEYLTQEQQTPDALAQLAELVTQPKANIIKLPNISASMPQLLAAIKELQAKGYQLPDYPTNPPNRPRKKRHSKNATIKSKAVRSILFCVRATLTDAPQKQSKNFAKKNIRTAWGNGTKTANHMWQR